MLNKDVFSLYVLIILTNLRKSRRTWGCQSPYFNLRRYHFIKPNINGPKILYVSLYSLVNADVLFAGLQSNLHHRHRPNAI